MAWLRLVSLAVTSLLVSPALWAWNPYDTDSSWSSVDSGLDRASPGDYRAPRPPRWDRSAADQRNSAWPGTWDKDSQWYQSSDQQDATWSSAPRDEFNAGGRGSVDGNWQSGSPAADWSDRDRWRAIPSDESDRWREMPSDENDRWRQSSQGGYWNETVPGRSWGKQQGPWSRDTAPERDARYQQRFSDSGSDRSYVTDGYEFRHDPDLDSASRGTHNGWEFRPRSERETERSLADSPYPRIDERDYLPRGPWRSYQDEGAAFGYHADEQRPSYSPQPPLR